MEKKKLKPLIILSTICLIVLMSVPCYASTIVPEEDIVDDVQQGITIFTVYNASITGIVTNNVMTRGNLVTPFERFTSEYLYLSKIENHDVNCEFSESSSQGTSETMTAREFASFHTYKSETNTIFDYGVANTIYSDFYINVEYNTLTWTYSAYDYDPYQEPSIKIKYSVIGNTEVRLIELTNIRNVNISEVVKNDIDENYNGVEEYNVYIWGIETKAYTYNATSSESSITTHSIVQSLTTDINVIKMNKNNSRNPDLIAHGEYVIEEYNKSFENITRDWTSWLGTAIGGFMSFEIVPYVSIGGIFATLIAIALTSLFIKIFMGG